MAQDKKTLVLVADDEPSTLALVTGHLRARGYKVIEATDGDQAWELAYEHLPHVVVLDVMMPGMSGWEVCRKIREAVSLAHTGVVMLTGIGENLNEMTSPLYGADAYIDKPFEFRELDAKIRETLASRRGGTLGRPDDADKQAAGEATNSAMSNGAGTYVESAPVPETARTSNGKPGAKPSKPKRSASAARTKPSAKAKPASAAPAARAKAAPKPKAKTKPAAKAAARAAKSAPKTKTKAAKGKSAAKAAKAKTATKGKPAVKAKPAVKVKAKPAARAKPAPKTAKGKAVTKPAPAAKAKAKAKAAPAKPAPASGKRPAAKSRTVRAD